MKNYSVYSAIGRIRRVFIFDTRQYRLLASGHPFQAVLDQYEKLVAGLNEGRTETDNVEVVIFFRINPRYPRSKHSAPNVNERKRLLQSASPQKNISLVPVNCNTDGVISKVSVPSKWAQDMIELVPAGKGKFHMTIQPDISSGFTEKLQEYAGDISIEVSNGKWQGGNLLRGKHGEQDYLLSAFRSQFLVHGKSRRPSDPDIPAIKLPGTRQPAPMPLPRLKDNLRDFVVNNIREKDLIKATAADIRIDEKRVIDIGVTFESLDEADRISGFHHLFFHADLYCTLAGPYVNKEIVLLATPFRERNRAIETPLDQLPENIRNRGNDADLNIPFYPISLPLILVGDDTGKLMYTLSYNNCLVENFMGENNSPCIRFYFPDFREPLTRYAGKDKKRIMQVRSILKNVIRWLHEETDPDKNHGNEPGHTAPDPILREKIIAAVPMDTGTEGIRTNTSGEIASLVESAQRLIGTLLEKRLPGVHLQAHFLEYPFRQYAHRHGALRCMTKVIERDKLD